MKKLIALFLITTTHLFATSQSDTMAKCFASKMGELSEKSHEAQIFLQDNYKGASDNFLALGSKSVPSNFINLSYKAKGLSILDRLCYMNNPLHNCKEESVRFQLFMQRFMGRIQEEKNCDLKVLPIDNQYVDGAFVSKLTTLINNNDQIKELEGSQNTRFYLNISLSSNNTLTIKGQNQNNLTTQVRLIDITDASILFEEEFTFSSIEDEEGHFINTKKKILKIIQTNLSDLIKSKCE